jgi:hypothetical protein
VRKPVGHQLTPTAIGIAEAGVQLHRESSRQAPSVLSQAFCHAAPVKPKFGDNDQQQSYHAPLPRGRNRRVTAASSLQRFSESGFAAFRIGACAAPGLALPNKFLKGNYGVITQIIPADEVYKPWIENRADRAIRSAPSQIGQRETTH